MTPSTSDKGAVISTNLSRITINRTTATIMIIIQSRVFAAAGADI